jgi:formylmethanofuran:tetrahydromethanopterin formyltransferase
MQCIKFNPQSGTFVAGLMAAHRYNEYLNKLHVFGVVVFDGQPPMNWERRFGVKFLVCHVSMGVGWRVISADSKKWPVPPMEKEYYKSVNIGQHKGFDGNPAYAMKCSAETMAHKLATKYMFVH